MTDTTAATRAVVDRLYEAFLAGDGDAMLALMHDDVDVRYLGQAAFQGREAFARFLGFAAGLLRDVDFRIRHCMVAGEHAAVLWEEDATTADGEPWHNHGVDLIGVRDGRIVTLHENNDTRLVHRHLPRYEESDE